MIDEGFEPPTHSFCTTVLPTELIDHEWAASIAHCCSSSLKRSYHNKTLTEHALKSLQIKTYSVRFPETDNYNVRVKSPVPGIFYLRKGLSQTPCYPGRDPDLVDILGFEPRTNRLWGDCSYHWTKCPNRRIAPPCPAQRIYPRLSAVCLRNSCMQSLRAGSWERVELNHHCLPLGNRFTVCRNTANRYRFPELPTLTAMFPRFEFHIRANILFEMIRRERTMRIWTATKP